MALQDRPSVSQERPKTHPVLFLQFLNQNPKKAIRSMHYAQFCPNPQYILIDFTLSFRIGGIADSGRIYHIVLKILQFNTWIC